MSHVVVHVPAVQPGVPPFAGHVLPHIPQLVAVFSGVSQVALGDDAGAATASAGSVHRHAGIAAEPAVQL
jgi:hypothetical protein